MYNFIKYSIKECVAEIILNRPEVLNSFNKQMSMELQEVLDKCASEKKVRSLYITGSGRAFCAGQDLSEAIAEDGPGLQSIVRDHYNPIIKKIRNIEKPVICAVNGVAAGAGANIALACDIVLAAKSSSFIQAFSKLGLVPDSGGTFFLPRLIGFQRALAITMLGDKISADQAYSWGMIYKVCEDEKLGEEAIGKAKFLSKMPTKGIGLTKRALNLSLKNNLEEQLDVEEELQTLAGTTYDYKEGVKAFLEKRTPEFIGE